MRVEITDTSCVKGANILWIFVNICQCVTDASVVGYFALELFPTGKTHAKVRSTSRIPVMYTTEVLVKKWSLFVALYSW
jgi:hypothetical protein